MLSSIIKRDEEQLNIFRLLQVKQRQLEEQALQRTHVYDEKSIVECKPPE